MGKVHDLRGLTPAQVNLLEDLLQENKDDGIYWETKNNSKKGETIY